MTVLKRTATTGYTQDPTKFFGFSRFAETCGDFVLIEGAFDEAAQWEQFGLSADQQAQLKAKKCVRLEFEEPNKFFVGDDTESYDADFYRIFTLCPYTSDWLNAKQHVARRVPIFFPFNEDNIPVVEEKKYDIIYTGHIVSPKLLRELVIMAAFKYRFVSNSTHPLVTNQSATYPEKMKLIAQTRITLVHNLLYPNSKRIRTLWRYQGWQDNHAFDLVPRPNQLWQRLTNRNVVVPQLKSRAFEAAFGRSLILCKRDPFNVIERYFEPGKEFVYYDEERFRETVSEILANYQKYEPIIERAYKRACENYTTAKFVENYLERTELTQTTPRHKAQNFIVMTSVYPPSEAVRRFAEHKDWQLVVAGDTKTPSDWQYPGVEYLSPEDQKQMKLRLVEDLPWKTYARKMTGYAYAIKQGAQLIADTDDDNIPCEDWAKRIDFSSQFEVVQHPGFLNVYQYFTEEHVWPRGFPLNRILARTRPDALPASNSRALKVGIWQFLADENPDVDAIYRLTNNKPVYFRKRDPIVLSPGTYCPFNSQNTFFRRETFPLLYLPAFVNFRFTDILRGLVAQPILWAAGYTLGFGHATVIQKRNPHDYLQDFESEIPCYLHPETIVELVSNAVSAEKSISANMIAAYEALHRANVVTERELKLLGSWLELFS